MRVSTGMIYDSGLASIQTRTSSLLNVQQQLSTGRRILKPSDDPVAAARALEVTQSLAANKAQAETRNNVKSAVGIADAQLQSATDLLTRVRELTVQAGNAALSSPDRRSIALELRQRFDELVAIANAKDGIGNSLFGGFQVGNKPFAGSVENGVRYLGDEGVRMLQVSSARQMGISQSGNDIFMRIPSGNGVFATATQNEKSVNSQGLTYEGHTGTSATAASFEIRFWRDADGVVATSGYAAGNATAGLIVTAGVNDEFEIALNGAAPALVTIPDGAYADADALATALNGVGVLPAGATALATTDGRIVIRSDSIGAGSTVSITAGVNDAVATVFGTPVEAAGMDASPGTTYYDLVDGSGNSLYTGAPSATGAGGSYTHAYRSGAQIDLSHTGLAQFNFGTRVTFSGIATTGDAFSIGLALGTTPVATADPANARMANATIDNGAVTDPIKWSQTANSGNLEVRFWVDVLGTVATSAQAAGTQGLQFPLIFQDGIDDRFSVSIDGGAPIIIDMDTVGPSTTYATPAELLNRIQAAVTGTAVPSDVEFGAWTDAISGADVGDTGISDFSMTLNGIPFYTEPFAPGATVTAADLDGALPAFLLDNPAITQVPGTSFANGDLRLINADGTGVTFAITQFDGGSLSPQDGVLTAGTTHEAGSPTFPGATVSMDSNGQLVFTSNSQGAGSSLTFADVQGSPLTALMGGVPTAASGVAPSAGQTFYDLVDATTGKSLFTGADSTNGGAGNTYTRPYVSGDDIAFYGAGGPGQVAFDFGGKFAVSGIPASGDTFTIKSSTDYTGNGYFVTDAKTTTRYNTGSGIIGAGDIRDPAKWNHPANSRNLEVRFWQDPDDPKTTYYDLVDAETEKSLFTDGPSTAGGTGNTYTRTFKPGDSIDFSGFKVPYGLDTITDFGISVTLSGQPASGDTFKIRASESRSVFDTLADTIKLLESGKPIETMGNVQLSNELGSILTSLVRAEDSILSARAVFGTRLAEVDSLDSVGSSLNIQFEETLSRLQDLDYAEAITKLTRQQMELQAAQQSFSKISQLTLFDYIR